MPLLPDIGSQKGSFELHLNLGSIQGESQSTLHAQEIEIVSFSWASSNSAVRSTGGSSTKGGKPTVGEITVTKLVDKATPQLFNALVTSALIKTAILSLSKSTGGAKPEDYVVITLTGVYITSVQLSSSRDQPQNQKGSETVTLNFQKVNIDYKVQLGTGLLASGGSASYDLTIGK